MSSNDLSLASNLFDFFHEKVDTVASQIGSDVGGAISEESVFYLTTLLADKARVSPTEEPQTLVELRMAAMEGGRIEAIRCYRRLGDRALYVTGFFPDSLERQTVSSQYYEDMGAAAYQSLYQLMSFPGLEQGLAEVFLELSSSFHECAEVIREVREEVREHSDVDIVRLYEEWIRTGSPRIAARLRDLGVVPMRPTDSWGSGGRGDGP
ncbi:MAG: hypothetical protein QGG40_15055 [Myxococcota bacterium]|jgi:hypothetical protein|nr:hypothetical protein [Myxococcota bacterium]